MAIPIPIPIRIPIRIEAQRRKQSRKRKNIPAKLEQCQEAFTHNASRWWGNNLCVFDLVSCLVLFCFPSIAFHLLFPRFGFWFLFFFGFLRISSRTKALNLATPTRKRVDTLHVCLCIWVCVCVFVREHFMS